MHQWTKDARKLRLIAQALDEQDVSPARYCSALRDVADRLVWAASGWPVARDDAESGNCEIKSRFRTFDELEVWFDELASKKFGIHPLQKDAERLEVVIRQILETGATPDGCSAVLHKIAQRLEAAADGVSLIEYVPPPLPDGLWHNPDPSIDELRDVVRAELDALARACESCRAALAGQAAVHQNDTRRHHGARHDSRVAQLIGLLCDDDIGGLNRDMWSADSSVDETGDFASTQASALSAHRRRVLAQK